MRTEIHRSGKLLITAEYLILRGARGLALPTSKGQRFEVEDIESEGLLWRSYDCHGKLWFSADFDSQWRCIRASDRKALSKLELVFSAIGEMKPESWVRPNGKQVETHLEFERDWGLGSSSSLISALAQWTGVDAQKLSDNSLGGSGYDVATASYGRPIIFWRQGGSAEVEEVNFLPDFKDKIWFIHLGHKQDSAKAVKDFGSVSVSQAQIEEMSNITSRTLRSKDLRTFESLISDHETMMERILGRQSVSSKYSAYSAGEMKSLGAWGGDFIMATGDVKDMDFFRNLGMETILSFDQMIKNA